MRHACVRSVWLASSFRSVVVLCFALVLVCSMANSLQLEFLPFLESVDEGAEEEAQWYEPVTSVLKAAGFKTPLSMVDCDYESLGSCAAALKGPYQGFARRAFRHATSLWGKQKEVVFFFCVVW